MTLLERLVQELPKLGGWPSDRTVASNGLNGSVTFHSKGRAPFVMAGLHFSGTGCVSYEEYEAALAASKQPEWNGEGLPPVGCECEALYDSCDKAWFRARIIAHDDKRIIGRWLEGSKADQLLDYPVIDSFRPILTEAERKREEAKNVIAELCRSSASNGHSADLIYDAIAAGKIPTSP
ncbi:hypothetical protein ACFQUX_08340 [Pantoea stewartii]